MPRTKISHGLAPLPRERGLKVDLRTTGGLVQILRTLALKNQREQPRVFYSLREVAQQYKVPVSSVAKIYREMEHEGLLSRVRSSKTILNGLRYNRHTVRAVVGLPVLFSNFVTIPDYRKFFLSIRHELWLRGFATTMVFFQPVEAIDGTLSDRLKGYEVDTVIWFQPGRTAKESLLRLSDIGIRVVVISQIGTPILPSRYYVWKERAIEALLRNWKESDPHCRITIVDCKDYRSPVIEEVLRLVVDGLGIESSIKTFHDQESHVFLRELCSLKTSGIVFSCSGVASLFSFQNPNGIADLLTKQRVGLIDGPIDLPFAEISDAPVDLVTVDWAAVAESIVNDMVTLEAFDQNRRTTFEAQVHFKIKLSSIAEPIRPSRSVSTV